MKYLKYLLIIIPFFIRGNGYAQDYTGTWSARQDDNVLETNTFIELKRVDSDTYKGQLVWEGIPYSFLGKSVRRGHMLYIPIKIYHNGKIADSANLHLYPIDDNRLDFIYDHTGRFASIYNMYCSEIAAAQALARLEALKGDSRSASNQCIDVAKKVFYAVANGDVSILKRYLTTTFYRTSFPYSDARTREVLLSVPKSKRDRLINHVNRAEITTIPSKAGDVVTVIFTNTLTGKDYTMQLIDEYENGDWKVFEILY